MKNRGVKIQQGVGRRPTKLYRRWSEDIRKRCGITSSLYELVDEFANVEAAMREVRRVEAEYPGVFEFSINTHPHSNSSSLSPLPLRNERLRDSLSF